MVSERDFELMDDYLSNKLNDQDKSSFEQRIKSDPELQKEFQAQHDLVEGIRQARAAELKTMLQNIPLSSIPTGQTSLATKVGSVIVIGGLVATGLYFYFGSEEPTSPVASSEQETIIPSETKEQPAPVEEPSTQPDENKVAENEITEAQKEKSKVESVKPAPVTRPKINVYDPANDDTQDGLDPQEQMDIISHAFVTSSIEVVTDTENKNYSFHYMFKDKKLVLFGIQEKDLYEILEFIYDDKRTIFLFCKSNYYWLDLNKDEPTKLIPIHDKALLGKLKKYRVK